MSDTQRDVILVLTGVVLPDEVVDKLAEILVDVDLDPLLAIHEATAGAADPGFRLTSFASASRRRRAVASKPRRRAVR